MPHIKTKRVVIGVLLSITAMGAVISCAVPHAEAGDRIKVFWTNEGGIDGKPNTAQNKCEATRKNKTTGSKTEPMTEAEIKELSELEKKETCSNIIAQVGYSRSGCEPLSGSDSSRLNELRKKQFGVRAELWGDCQGQCKPYFVDRYPEGTDEYKKQIYFCTDWIGKDDDSVTSTGSWILGAFNGILVWIVKGLGYLLSMLMILIETFMEYAFDEPERLHSVWEAFRDFTNIILALALASSRS